MSLKPPEPTQIEELLGRLSNLEMLVSSLMQQVPAGLIAQNAAARARLDAIEQQEDPLEPIIHESISYGPTIPVGTRQITITGTRARYVWVYFTTDPATAEYRTITQDPMPDGVQIYDTAFLPWSVQRTG